MDILKAKTLTTSQKRDILGLWNTEYPAHVGHETLADLESYLTKLGSPLHFLICDSNDCVKGWLVTFDREGARWFAMILHHAYQGKGLGRTLLDAAKEMEQALNGWATDHDRDTRSDGKPYVSPIGFYLKNGFQVLEDTRLEKGELSTVKIRWCRE